jgi:hypothetical protein
MTVTGQAHAASRISKQTIRIVGSEDVLAKRKNVPAVSRARDSYKHQVA